MKIYPYKIYVDLPSLIMSNVMYQNTDNSLPDNLEVMKITFDAIGFDAKDAPKIKKLVKLKNRRDKLEKEIKELEDSLIK